MKVEILQEKFSKSLSFIARVVATKPTLPVLANVLIIAQKDGVLLSATDLSLGIKLWVGAKVISEGSITVPAKILGDLVASLPPSTIEVSVEGESLLISCSGNKARLSGISAKEFPSLGEFESKRGFWVEAGEFKKAIERVTVAVSTDETRPILSGVLWKLKERAIQLAATDGYRLSVVQLVAPKEGKQEEWFSSVKKVLEKEIIIPARALKDVERLMEEMSVKRIKVGLVKDQNLMIFKVGDGEITTRLIEGSFPNFEQVIPKEKKGRVEIEVEPLIEAIRTASIFARDSANIIHWKIETERLIISANAPSYGESESNVEIKLDGEGGEIAFNSRYLLDLLSIFPAKKVMFTIKDSLDPGVFESAGEGENKFLHLIMPVRIQK